MKSVILIIAMSEFKKNHGGNNIIAKLFVLVSKSNLKETESKSH